MRKGARGGIASPENVFPVDDPLRDSEASLRLLVNGVKDYAIILLDHNGRVATWNEGARRLKGYSEAEIIGRSLREFYPPEAVAAGVPDRLLTQAAEEGRVEDEGWRVRKDGSRFFADVILTAIRNPAGELLGFAKITRNISKRRQTEDALSLSEQRFRLLVGAVKDYAIIMLDPTGRIMSWNEGANRLKGYTEAEIIGRSMKVFYPPEAVAAGLPDTLLAQAEAHGRIEDEGWRIRKDGSRFFADVVLTALRDADDKLAGFAKITRNITDRREAEDKLRASEERYRLLADNATDVIMLVGSDGKRLYVSPASRPLFGYEPEELIGVPVAGLVHPDDRTAWSGSRRENQQSSNDDIVEATYRCIRKDGSTIWVESSRHRLPDDAYVVSIRDISERKRIQEELAAANQQLQELATQDGLTGLANRRHFDERLLAEIRRATRDGTTVALIMIDVDHFKQFNDRYGHLAGDDCLRAIARTLKMAVRRPGDLAARYGGEEFVLLLPSATDIGVQKVARRVLREIRDLRIPHELSPDRVVTISAGVATILPTPDSQRAEELIRKADEQLYRAKSLGRNQISG